MKRRTPVIVLDVPTYMMGGGASKRSKLQTFMKKMKKLAGTNSNNTSQDAEQQYFPSMNYTMSELTGHSETKDDGASSFLFIRRWKDKATETDLEAEENQDELQAEDQSKSIVFIQKWEPGLKTCHESSSQQ